MDEDKACRACSIAFWDANGMTVDAAERYGLDPAGRLEDRAWMSSLELSDDRKSLSASPHFRIGGEFEIPEAAKLEASTIQLDAYGWKPESAKPKTRSLLREVRFLRPGKWAGYDFTDDDLQAFAMHFDPLDNPPIILDHDTATVKGLSGYIRGLRYEPGFDETGGTLWALWEFLGDHACDQVEQGLWKRVSGGFIVGPELKDKRVLEGSVVLWGAYDRGIFDRAQILRKEPVFMSLPNTKPAETKPAEGQVPASTQAETDAAPAETKKELSALPGPTTDRGAQPASSDFLARLEAVENENKRLVQASRLKDDENQVLEFISLGLSVPAPEVGKAELAFLQSLPEGKLRNDYVALRKRLPKCYPEGGQLSEPTVKEPGTGVKGQADSGLVTRLSGVAKTMGLIAPESKEVGHES